MSWAPIADLLVGDQVISFTDMPSVGRNRIWELGEVLATWETTKPTVEFELATGARIIASEDHRWLLTQRGRDTWWRETINLNFKTQVKVIPCEPTDTDRLEYQTGYIAGATAGDGTFRWPGETGQQIYWRVAKPERDRVVLDRLVDYLSELGIDSSVRAFDSGGSGFHVNKPLPMMKVEIRRAAALADISAMSEERPSREWMAGWLAGMFDTDASYCGSLRFCQSKPNDVLDRVVRYGKELGFDLRREDFAAACPTARLNGGVAENLGFLSSISPALTRRCQDFYGRRVDAYSSPVVAVRRGPVRRLIDITTSTGTFIAEGALTHNCYALTMAGRLKAMGNPKYQRDGDPATSGPGFGVTTHPDTLGLPLTWRKPRRVFVNSMADLFHDVVPDEFIARVWAVMAETPHHSYQILTKRHGRMRSLLNSARWPQLVAAAVNALADEVPGPIPVDRYDAAYAWATSPEYVADQLQPLEHIWLGVSVEDQKRAELRIPALRDTPAAVRFLSCEPLIAPVDLSPWLDTPSIDWVILGGESGGGARPCEPEWIRALIKQCQAADVPVFCKQLGSVWARENGCGGKGGLVEQWPPDLRIREFPAVVAS